MEEEESTRTKVLEVIGTYLTTPLFTESLLDIIKNTSSGSSLSFSSDEKLQTYLLSALHHIETTQYLYLREIFPKSTAVIDICLNINRYKRPREFRRYARMSPYLFGLLVQQLETQPVFSNDSSNGEMQIPVERQLLTTLIRMGSYGNAASLAKIGDLCGMGKGTVDKVCRRVLIAIQSSTLRTTHVRWPVGAEREEAKRWVEEQVSLSEWRNGFCMVDGTLIPLYRKPSHYGETFFDRKCNYSINVQIINTPNRKIIDYASGFRGSRHDTHCFASTKLGKNPSRFLGQHEWCWGDAGYPLQKWLMIPYKSPATSLKLNRTFNFHLFRIRIRSEHTIGYLKGRFQSLKELRFQILNAQDLAYVTLWIKTCIIFHAFCLDYELEVELDWLKNGMNWEREQNKDIERDQEAENMPTGGRQARQALVERKRVYEQKKH